MKSPPPSPLLDLHGYKVDDVPDAVDKFLMRHMRAGKKRVRIMTGKGTGQVKKAVVDYLRLGGYPFENERTTPGGPRNEGVLVVILDD